MKSSGIVRTLRRKVCSEFQFPVIDLVSKHENCQRKNSANLMGIGNLVSCLVKKYES